jgi:uncharacterized protein
VTERNAAGSAATAFRAPWWARGPHAQTLAARVLRSARGPTLHRERLETPDGDFLDVDWGPDPSPEAPLALVLHGLEGTSRRPYVRNVCRALFEHGVRPVALNFRGCSGEPNRGLRFYHSGETEDVSWLLGVLKARHGARSIGAIGFSLGGNVLLKLLGEREDGGTGLLGAAAAISVPYDLDAGCALLERSLMGRLYSEYFLRSLRRKVRAKRVRLAELLDVEAAELAATVREFDERVTAPLNGFEDAADYYARCSSARYLEHVRVPTLLVHALDDPFLPSEAVPTATAEANPAVELRLTERGGHVGFLSGAPWAPRFWADDAAAAFIADTLRPTRRDVASGNAPLP